MEAFTPYYAASKELENAIKRVFDDGEEIYIRMGERIYRIPPGNLFIVENTSRARFVDYRGVGGNCELGVADEIGRMEIDG